MKRNHFYQLNISGRLIKGRVNLIDKIRLHFIYHFKQVNLPNITLPLGSFKMVNPKLASSVDLVHEAKEIIMAIKRCDPSKAPRYDGFNLKFLLSM